MIMTERKGFQAENCCLSLLNVESGLFATMCLSSLVALNLELLNQKFLYNAPMHHWTITGVHETPQDAVAGCRLIAEKLNIPLRWSIESDGCQDYVPDWAECFRGKLLVPFEEGA